MLCWNITNKFNSQPDSFLPSYTQSTEKFRHSDGLTSSTGYEVEEFDSSFYTEKFSSSTSLRSSRSNSSIMTASSSTSASIFSTLHETSNEKKEEEDDDEERQTHDNDDDDHQNGHYNQQLDFDSSISQAVNRTPEQKQLSIFEDSASRPLFICPSSSNDIDADFQSEGGFPMSTELTDGVNLFEKSQTTTSGKRKSRSGSISDTGHRVCGSGAARNTVKKRSSFDKKDQGHTIVDEEVLLYLPLTGVGFQPDNGAGSLFYRGYPCD